MKRPRKRVEQLGYVEGPKDGSYFLRYWSAVDAEGNRVRRAVEVGRKGQFQSREEANLSVEAAMLRRRINAGAIGQTIGQVVAEFERDRMPARDNTCATARVNLKHIVTAWKDELVATLSESTESKRLEGWLSRTPRLDKKPGTLSFPARKNVKQQMATIFDFAMERGYIPSNVNPMERVKLTRTEAVKRRQRMSPKEMNLFFEDPGIPEYVKVMAHIAKRTGLRVSEIVGLKKDDFDLDENLVTVGRRVYRGGVAGPKSKKSGDPVPFPDELYDILQQWLKSPNYEPNFEGWLFQSPITRRPYSADGMQLRYLEPFGARHGIVKMGWHTFRHGYKDYLKQIKTPLDEIKRLMRHSRIQTTDDYGSDSDMDTLRERQRAAVEAMERQTAEVRKRRWA